MDFRLTDDQRTRIEAAEAVGRALQVAPDQPFGDAAWKQLAAARLTGLCAPRAVGGQGLGALDSALVMEALGRHVDHAGLLLTLGSHLCAAIAPLVRADANHPALPGLCSGGLGAGAMTEPDAGSDIDRVSLRADPVDGGFRLNGRKTLITGATLADTLLVYARTDSTKGLLGGYTVFLVPASSDGLTTTELPEPSGCRGAGLGSLTLDNVVVTHDAVVGRVGGGGALFQTSMTWERVVLFAAWLGTQQRLINGAVERANSRSQGGVTIGHHQAVSHRIADMHVRLESSRWLIYRAAAAIDDREPDAFLNASVAKLSASEALLKTAEDALRVQGGAGYLASPWERALRDAFGAVVYSGTSDIQRTLIARWLGVGR